MTQTPAASVPVVVAMDFDDAILAQLRAISPRLSIERYFPIVPERAWHDAEVLYTNSILPAPEQAPRLRWIQLHTAGVEDALKHPILKAQDIEVTNTSGIHAVQVAEYSLMMMLAFNYQLASMVAAKERIEWPSKPGAVYHPAPLRGQTVGIVGYGSIGREVARLAVSAGMTVLAAKRDIMHPEQSPKYAEPGTGDPTSGLPDRLYPMQAIASMAKDCDFLVVACPLTRLTRHLINEEVLAAMKQTAVLINVARGPVVDEPALISALAAGRIGGAALDVFEEEPLPATSPLWNLPNVILSPHVAGIRADYHQQAAAVFAENLRRYLENDPLLNQVNREREY
ncbi:MAG TPA: D-2-hydroxyacid dehydrogenase [Candidatus Limnocylindrales bacterium]|nr:D-2-hydroxyacid dehydrogenase [Candidatus Limnocylindrales bacterium]